MKIVNVCLCGPVTDGWLYQDNLLPKYQKRIGHDVTVVTSCFIYDESGKIVNTSPRTYFNEDGVKTVRLETTKKTSFSNRFKRFSQLIETLESEKPDILFVHGVQFLDIFKIVKYLKKHHIICYVDNHADSSNSGTNWISKNVLHRIIWRICAKKINPYVDKFYGVLPCRVEWLQKMYKIPKEKCFLLPMGVDDDEVNRIEYENNTKIIKEKYNIDDEDFVIVTGGKIDSAKKETLDLMKAFTRTKNARIKLLVFGSVDDNIKDEFNKCLSDNRISYIGWVSGKYSYDIFSIASLVVFPGRHSVYWEQVVGIGIPLMCKYWYGTDDVDLGGNVVFLNTSSEEEIYEKINLLISNEKIYKDMKEVAQKKGKSFFSYLNIAKRSINYDE